MMNISFNLILLSLLPIIKMAYAMNARPLLLPKIATRSSQYFGSVSISYQQTDRHQFQLHWWKVPVHTEFPHCRILISAFSKLQAREMSFKLYVCINIPFPDSIIIINHVPSEHQSPLSMLMWSTLQTADPYRTWKPAQNQRLLYIYSQLESQTE